MVVTTIVALVKHETGATVQLPFTQCLRRIRRLFRRCQSNGSVCDKFYSTPTRAVKDFVGDEQPSEMTLLESEDDIADGAHQLRVIRSASSSSSTNHVNMDQQINCITDLPHVTEITRDYASADEPERDLSLIETYRVMFGVLQLKPVLQYIGLLFLVRLNSDSTT
ncbi:unnamed protein product [Echinostoma caproni]|uniref:Uncharacterized protein n=1 Tax=Echinostoma caproni TaxID=27848 RepID=A0A183A4L5_9TREM|nr:unnamed protein product [Echinostoma caproni]